MKEEQKNKGIEFIENGLHNLGNAKRVGSFGLVDYAIDQITNGIKLIKEEDEDDGMAVLSKFD